MKGLTLVLVVISLSGCVGSMPLHSFAPYTTADGQERWRMAVKGFDEVTIQAMLENEIGRGHLCPNGWDIKSRIPTNGFELIDGECKK